jgi:Na+/glutamate symporter
MGLKEVAERNRARSRQIHVFADVALAVVLALFALVMFKPKMTSSLDVPFKIFVPLSAILLVARAVASSKEQS